HSAATLSCVAEPTKAKTADVSIVALPQNGNMPMKMTRATVTIGRSIPFALSLACEAITTSRKHHENSLLHRLQRHRRCACSLYLIGYPDTPRLSRIRCGNWSIPHKERSTIHAL